MPLAQHDDVVKAFSPNRTNHTFNVWILPELLRRGRNILNQKRPHLPSESFPEDRVAVSHEISRLIVDFTGLKQLACCPTSCRMLRDVHMQDPPSVMGQNNQQE